jgi:hypothetical protein
MPDQEMTFTVAMRHFFGYGENQDVKGFSEEIKSLSDVEKAEFKALLDRAGYKIKQAIG